MGKLKFYFNGIVVQPCCNIFHLVFKRFHLSWYCLHFYLALLQHLLVNHISCFIKWLSWHSLDSKGAAILCTYPGRCYVELSMTKDWLLQPHTNLLEGVTLCFVDGCSKGNPDRKLTAGPLKWVFFLCRPKRDPRDGYCYLSLEVNMSDKTWQDGRSILTPTN